MEHTIPLIKLFKKPILRFVNFLRKFLCKLIKFVHLPIPECLIKETNTKLNHSLTGTVPIYVKQQIIRPYFECWTHIDDKDTQLKKGKEVISYLDDKNEFTRRFYYCSDHDDEILMRGKND